MERLGLNGTYFVILVIVTTIEGWLLSMMNSGGGRTLRTTLVGSTRTLTLACSLCADQRGVGAHAFGALVQCHRFSLVVGARLGATQRAIIASRHELSLALPTNRTTCLGRLHLVGGRARQHRTRLTMTQHLPLDAVTP